MLHTTPKISLIAAIGKNRELGRGNELIFKIPEDMKFFRETTRGHAVIMGRKTFESIGKPLPDRLNIVISRSPNSQHPTPNIMFVNSIEEAIELGKTVESEELFIIGGAQIYALAMPYADRLYLTLVDSDVKDADAFFPEYSGFKVIAERKSQDDNYSYTFQTLDLTKI